MRGARGAEAGPASLRSSQAGGAGHHKGTRTESAERQGQGEESPEERGTTQNGVGRGRESTSEEKAFEWSVDCA